MEQVLNDSNSTKAVKIPNVAHSGWYRKHSDIFAVFKRELKFLVWEENNIHLKASLLSSHS